VCKGKFQGARLLRKYYLRYWEMGISVIPVIGKRSVVEGWSRWCAEPQPKELLEDWENRFPLGKFGIAVCAGPASNIDALDIDSNSKDILDLCPRSPVTRVGYRGGMPLFRHNSNLTKVKRDRDNLEKDPLRPREGIQLLTTGNYFVIPPSIHPDSGVPYRWIGEYNLENFTVLDLEQLSQSELDFVYVYIARFPLTNADGSAMGDAAGRNDKLTVMCYAKIKNDLCKSDEEIAEELISYDNEKHFPPYFSDPREMYFRKASSPFGRALIFVKGSRERMIKKGHI
jgi:hypothetical protein